MLERPVSHPSEYTAVPADDLDPILLKVLAAETDYAIDAETSRLMVATCFQPDAEPNLYHQIAVVKDNGDCVRFPVVKTTSPAESDQPNLSHRPNRWHNLLTDGLRQMVPRKRHAVQAETSPDNNYDILVNKRRIPLDEVQCRIFSQLVRKAQSRADVSGPGLHSSGPLLTSRPRYWRS